MQIVAKASDRSRKHPGSRIVTVLPGWCLNVIAFRSTTTSTFWKLTSILPSSLSSTTRARCGAMFSAKRAYTRSPFESCVFWKRDAGDSMDWVFCIMD